MVLHALLGGSDLRQKSETILKDTSSTSISQPVVQREDPFAKLLKWLEAHSTSGKDTGKDYVVLSTRLSLNHQINPAKLTPWEKIYAGAIAAYRGTQAYAHFEQRRQAEELRRQYTTKIAALSAVATLLNLEIDDPRGKPIERHIMIPIENQYVITDLPCYFPEWQITIIPAHSQINNLCQLPTLVTFRRRLL